MSLPSVCQVRVITPPNLHFKNISVSDRPLRKQSPHIHIYTFGRRNTEGEKNNFADSEEPTLRP